MPKLILKDPCDSTSLSPIAIRTCDGSDLVDEHADPVDEDMPFESSVRINDSPSIAVNLKFALFGRRLVL